MLMCSGVVQGVEFELQLPPKSPLMAQPPADHRMGAAALLHYTWGSIFKDKNQNNTEVWKFDKRFFTGQDVALKVCSRRQPRSCLLLIVSVQ